jgi:hypothetical protein
MESPFEDERSDDTDEHNWSQDVEGRLEAIQDNSAQQALISKQQYLDLLYLQKFFKIPVIVVSASTLYSLSPTTPVNPQ